jgi:phospholipase C
MAICLVMIIIVSVFSVTVSSNNQKAAATVVDSNQGSSTTTTTSPIKHLVIIFQENISYDHYFATYPRATNPANEPAFNADPNTPSSNGLTQELIDNNPNSAKPFRLDRSQAITCDEDHEYKAE